MRRLMLFLVMAPVVVLTVPATAQTPEELVTCPAPPEGTTVVGANHSAMPAIASPVTPNGGSVTLNYQLDLSPATAASKASVGAYLQWTIPFSNWNLYLVDGAGATLVASDRFQPVHPFPGSQSNPPRPSSPYENVFRLNVAHCSLFGVKITNSSALAGPVIDAIDPLRLEIETGLKR